MHEPRYRYLCTRTVNGIKKDRFYFIRDDEVKDYTYVHVLVGTTESFPQEDVNRINRVTHDIQKRQFKEPVCEECEFKFLCFTNNIIT